MPKPGEVYGFHSKIANKYKYHLCVSLDGYFLFLNSPKKRPYGGDFSVSNEALPFLPKTENGISIISCSTVLTFSERDFIAIQPTKLGEIPSNIMADLVDFIESTPVLSRSEKDKIINGLENWV